MPDSLQVKAEKPAIIVPWTTINRVGLQEIDIRERFQMCTGVKMAPTDLPYIRTCP